MPDQQQTVVSYSVGKGPVGDAIAGVVNTIFGTTLTKTDFDPNVPQFQTDPNDSSNVVVVLKADIVTP